MCSTSSEEMLTACFPKDESSFSNPMGNELHAVFGMRDIGKLTSMLENRWLFHPRHDTTRFVDCSPLFCCRVSLVIQA